MKPEKFVNAVLKVYPNAKAMNDHGMVYFKFCMKDMERIVTTMILNLNDECILKMIGNVNDPKDLEISSFLIDELCIGEMMSYIRFIKEHDWKVI